MVYLLTAEWKTTDEGHVRIAPEASSKESLTMRAAVMGKRAMGLGFGSHTAIQHGRHARRIPRAKAQTFSQAAEFVKVSLSCSADPNRLNRTIEALSVKYPFV